MKTTEENLKDAFAGESQANRKYLAFAKKADKEGFINLANLFRATAEAETIHAHGHLDAMNGVSSSIINLKTAIEGESYEYEVMYPAMFKQAEKEGHKAKKMFKWAMQSEKIHAELYKKALAAIESGKDLDGEVYLCPICGHVELKEPTENCPICGVPSNRYVLYQK